MQKAQAFNRVLLSLAMKLVPGVLASAGAAAALYYPVGFAAFCGGG